MIRQQSASLSQNLTQPPTWRLGPSCGANGWEIYNNSTNQNVFQYFEISRACGPAINLPVKGHYTGFKQACPSQTLSLAGALCRRRILLSTHPPIHAHTSVICYHHNAALCLFQQICDVVQLTRPPIQHTCMHMYAYFSFGSCRIW